jgi:hypothetical protein
VLASRLTCDGGVHEKLWVGLITVVSLINAVLSADLTTAPRLAMPFA